MREKANKKIEKKARVLFHRFETTSNKDLKPLPSPKENRIKDPECGARDLEQRDADLQVFKHRG